MSMILWIDEIDMGQVSAAGPKVAKLGDLAQAGLAVPKGFAVTTDAYRAVIGQGDTARQIDGLIAQADPEDEPAIGELAARVRKIVQQLTLPADVTEAIRSAYAELAERCGTTRLATAVRSSATGEDASDASFAGQFDTYLGITGADNVVDAVRSCWASLFTERGVRYRLQRGLSHTECPMAVGVLELIEARASGVAFSVHPVTGQPDRIVMEGSWGWGEAVVGGLVVPDHAEVGKSDNRILDYVINDKAVMSSFDREAGAVREIPMPDELRAARVLTDIEVIAIADAVRRIEGYFGHPVDVEWVTSEAADDAASITIVQARPETVHSTSSAPPPRWDPAGYALKYAFGKKKS